MKLLFSIFTMLLPMVVSAYDVKINGIYYNLDQTNKTATVTYLSFDSRNKNAYSGDVFIPNEVTHYGRTYSVTSIGDGAFFYCSNLKTVTIPNSVTSIGDEAFPFCSNLTSVIVPNSVTSIGYYAFGECGSLTSPIYNSEIFIFMPKSYSGEYEIPNGIKTIWQYAFSDCDDLTSVTIPNSVTSIGVYSFMNCSNLNSISIGDGIMSIGKVAFSGCKSLSSIAIPNSVTSIGDYAFRWCYSLTSVAIPNSVTSIGEFAFYECKGLTSVIIGNNVTSIGNSAFRGCSGLTSIIIPNSVSSIGNEAFQGYELLEVISKIKNPFIINTNTFSHNTFNNATLYVPAGTIAKYKATESWNNFVFIKEENADKYKLTYLVDNEEYKSCDLEEGESIIPEDEPTKEGYTFSGWSEIPETMPAHDVTVTGSFTINKYKLVYKVDGEDYKSYEVEYGATITPEEEPTKEGYTFSGWSWIPTKMPAENVTITGSFKINQYTITYVIDGEVYQTEKVDYNSKITPPTPPEKTGFDFVWGEYPETMPAHDITISGTYTTGIMSIEIDSDKAKIFALDGKQIYQPQKGVNIVRMKNGSIKKVVVK